MIGARTGWTTRLTSIRDHAEPGSLRDTVAGCRGKVKLWFPETFRIEIDEDELIALDTDLVSCHGYTSDVSRMSHSGPGIPTAAQPDLHKGARTGAGPYRDIDRRAT